nr:MAG TPA: hypothetical protein [Caudoviricetes sp.]
MNWVFLLIVVAGITAFAVWHEIKNQDMLSFFVGLVGVGFTLFALTFVIVQTIEVPKSVNNFERQKAYIETHVAKNDIEDAALTAKKIELNEWLYDVQLSKSRFGGWSFYPDSIFELEPIE